MQQDGVPRGVVRDASLLRLARRVAERAPRSSVGRAVRDGRGGRAVSALQPISVPPTAAGTHEEHDYHEDPEDSFVHIQYAINDNCVTVLYYA